MTDTTDPQNEYTAEIAERTVVVTWPDNERGGATLPPDGWQERAWEQSTLHEIDEGSVTGCSVLRWRDDPRTDAELVAVSLALVTGKPVPASAPPAPAVPPGCWYNAEAAEKAMWAESMTATSASPPVAADRSGLRERIAEALVRWTYRGKDPEHGGILETVRANAYSRADAVLSVLPPAADRAAVYRQLADQQTQLAVADDLDRRRDMATARRQLVKELRRMAAEAQQLECALCGHRTCMLGKPCGVIATEHGDLAERCGCTGGEEQQAETQGRDALMAAHAALAAHAGRQQAVLARIGQMADHWEQQLPEVIRTPAVVSALRAALEPAVVAEPGKENDGPRTVCVCGHTRGGHAVVSGRLLCDECDGLSPDACKEFEAL